MKFSKNYSSKKIEINNDNEARDKEEGTNQKIIFGCGLIFWTQGFFLKKLQKEGEKLNFYIITTLRGRG